MSASTARVVWVSGATSGIGRACVYKLVAQGHRVVALGRRIDRLEALRQSLSSDSVRAVACDVQDIHEIREVQQNLPPAFAAADTLINNAGLMLGTGLFDTLTEEEMYTMVMTNCMGVLHTTSVLLSSLKASGRGHIVNVTSIGGRYPYVTGHVYAATKAFVEQFSGSLRPELAGDHVRVTTVAPGRVDTEFQLVRAGRAGVQACEPTPGIPTLQAEDVADAICWALDQPAHANVNAIELVPAGHALSFR